MVLPVSAPAAGEIVKAANPAAGDAIKNDAIKNKVIAEFDALALQSLQSFIFSPLVPMSGDGARLALRRV
jgi:hypothetical protein